MILICDRVHRMPHHDETHELPAAEAVIAGLMALMTGHSQSLLAGQPPQGRVVLGRRIDELFDLLAVHPRLSDEFRGALASLHRRWRAFGDCSAGALHAAPPRDPGLAHPAPARLQ
jgi:hypothetical protein